MLFQTCMTFFISWNTKGENSKNVLAAHFHAMRISKFVLCVDKSSQFSLLHKTYSRQSGCEIIRHCTIFHSLAI